jgi:diguanylate cyclase (GGDEF)-like protein
MAITTLREIDVFARIGGEEFAAALPDTNLEAGVLVANRLRTALAKLKVKVKDIEITFTVSIGATLARSEDQNIEEAINRADEALYKAKKTGRNKVEKN